MDNKEIDFNNLDALSLEDLFGDKLAEEDSVFEENVEVLVNEDLDETVTELEPKQKRGKNENRPWQKSALLYLHDLVFLLAAVVIVFLLLFRVVVVSGTSMNNTLLDGDYLLLVGDLFYRNPEQGDVIVASKDSFDNGAPIVKRVIATERQWVDIDFRTGSVYVGDTRDNMRIMDEPYTLTPTTLYEGIDFPLQVEDGCIFVMGDNRNDSKDSRNPQIGQIDCREILGKVVYLFVPGTNKGEVQRDFSRIGVVS